MIPLTQIKNFSKNLLFLEGFLLFAGIYFFWYPSNFPGTVNGVTGIESREWLWLLGLFIPATVLYFSRVPKHWGLVAITVVAYIVFYIELFRGTGISTAVDRADYITPILSCIPLLMILRYIAYGRLWTHTWLDVWFIAFILLCILSVHHAPYPSRGYKMLGRPLLGMGWVIYLVELRRTTGKMDIVLWLMIGMALLVGVLALFDTQWTTKSLVFEGVITRLPHVDFFFAGGGLNPNEIGGALAWLVPLMGGLYLYRPQIVWRGVTGTIFMILALSLLLGQSRAAIAGVLLALSIIIWFVLQGRMRHIALTAIAVVLSIQAAILFNVFPNTTSQGAANGDVGLSARDESTAGQRFAIWDASFEMVKDYPLTGVGMNSFRAAVGNAYPIQGREGKLTPHAHNEFVQIMTDLGIPGLIIFTGWHITLGYMLWRCWRTGRERILTLAIFGGLLAHGIYGMGDAIPVWDRFSFLYWVMVGCAAALYIHLFGEEKIKNL